MLDVFFAEVVIDLEFALAHEGAGEFPGESVEREVVLTHGKAVGVGFHEVDEAFRAGGFQPHGVVTPISTEFQHGRRRRQLREHFLKNEFLKRFVDAAIDGQNQAEIAVVGKGTAEAETRRPLCRKTCCPSTNPARGSQRMARFSGSETIWRNLPTKSLSAVLLPMFRVFQRKARRDFHC